MSPWTLPQQAALLVLGSSSFTALALALLPRFMSENIVHVWCLLEAGLREAPCDLHSCVLLTSGPRCAPSPCASPPIWVKGLQCWGV